MNEVIKSKMNGKSERCRGILSKLKEKRVR